MLRSLESMRNYVLQARDGEIGRCKDSIFDDRNWTGVGIWGKHARPRHLAEDRIPAAEPETQVPEGRPATSLRSVKEVTGYHIQAKDGEIGHVEDLIADDETWIIRYLVVDTRNWLPGRKVLVSPTWAEAVDRAQRKVMLGLSRKEVKQSPEYDPSQPVNRQYEGGLYDYYGRPRYWD